MRVACRGRSGGRSEASIRATSCAEGPLIRMTPMPPRPAGVAMATIVSEGENIRCGTAMLNVQCSMFGAEARQPRSSVCARAAGCRHERLSTHRNDDRFQERIANALRRHLRVLGHGQVHEPASIGIERTYFLRAGGACLLHHEARHLTQLGVLRLAIIHAVDDK